MADDIDIQSEAPGWYGKLATLGDFASRRLTPTIVERTDAWLSQAMGASRAQLGPAWLEHYLTAPLLRFAWAPGVVDEAWWFGVLMASCDNVGRYFPLLIASRRSEPPQTNGGLDHLDAWFDHLARAAAQTLDEDASIASFEKALDAAPRWPPPSAPSTGAVSQVTAANGLAGQPCEPDNTVRRWVRGMAIVTLEARFAGCSIWWHPGEDGMDAAIKVVSGLPEPGEFAAMLSTW